MDLSPSRGRSTRSGRLADASAFLDTNPRAQANRSRTNSLGIRRRADFVSLLKWWLRLRRVLKLRRLEFLRGPTCVPLTTSPQAVEKAPAVFRTVFGQNECNLSRPVLTAVQRPADFRRCSHELIKPILGHPTQKSGAFLPTPALGCLHKKIHPQ